jgi:hypothetical protein
MTLSHLRDTGPDTMTGGDRPGRGLGAGSHMPDVVPRWVVLVLAEGPAAPAGPVRGT